MKNILIVLLVITSNICFGDDLTCEIQGRLAGVTIAQKNNNIPRKEVLRSLNEYLISQQAPAANITYLTDFVGKVYDTEIDTSPSKADFKYWNLCQHAQRENIPKSGNELLLDFFERI